MNYEEFKKAFIKKYGKGVEVKVPEPVRTIKDFQAGSGFVKYIRVNKDTNELEYYHDWWQYGWFPIKGNEYQNQALKALSMLIDIEPVIIGELVTELHNVLNGCYGYDPLHKEKNKAIREMVKKIYETGFADGQIS